jgi:Mg2+ and Co2+ transporter CorA
LVGSRDERTQFWKGAIQESLQQSLVEIGSVVSIMMSFLTYITGFFMNFELLPILTDYEN